MSRNKTMVILLFAGVISCAYAKSDESQTKSPNVNLDMTNSCIKTFCGFAFGSPYQGVDFMTNGVVESSNYYPASNHSQYRVFTNITVKLERPFRYCTQAQLEYTPYTMKLFKVTIKGHIGTRLTHESLLEESNKMRMIIEGQCHFCMKDNSIRSASRLLLPNRSLSQRQNQIGDVGERDTPLRALPFTWSNPYCWVMINSFVDDNGTTFQISVEDLMTEREDKESEIATRKDLSLDSSQDSDMELLSIVPVPEEQRIQPPEQVMRRKMDESLPRKEADYLLEPLLSFTNAIERVKKNDSSGYYSLALHFAKGEEVNRHYPRACQLLEQAVSNHCSNAELIYAMIQIGNSDLATGDDRTRGMGTHWGMGFRRPVSGTKQKLNELFKQYTGLPCETSFFRDINGVDLTNESEVARIRLSLHDSGWDSGERMNISKKIFSLLDELVAEKRRNIEETREKLQREKETHERREKNEELVESLLGSTSDSLDATNNMRNGYSVQSIGQQTVSVSGERGDCTDKEREEREELRGGILQLRDKLRMTREERLKRGRNEP